MENQLNATGRRKSSVARVYIKKGTGTITINGKALNEYFKLQYLVNQVNQPLEAIEATKMYDVAINASGGGIKGQAEAIKLGIARVLCELDEKYRPALKHAGLLRRDPRVVERKKFGLKKARKSFQFSKR